MRKLGIDYGDSRVGIAITDALNITVQGLETIHHKGNDKIVLARLDEIFANFEVDTIVIGMPLNMDGSSTFRVDATNKFVTDENGSKLTITTDSKGAYEFENIEEGSYMVVFTYDNLKYRNTEYQAKSATETTNSDIITGTITTDSNSKVYAMTDKLVLTNKSLEHIDAGFIENEVFDLKIKKGELR